jgi:hypothetical protein
LFNQLETYSNKNKYQFKIAERGLKQIYQITKIYYCNLTVTNGVEDYCVVVETVDSIDIQRNAPMRKHSGQQEILVMKDVL